METIKVTFGGKNQFQIRKFEQTTEPSEENEIIEDDKKTVDLSDVVRSNPIFADQWSSDHLEDTTYETNGNDDIFVFVNSPRKH